MILFLTRHGETFWSKEQRCQTWSDNVYTHLTQEGYRNAITKGKVLKDQGIEMIARSQLERTKQTTHAIARELDREIDVMDTRYLNDGNLGYMDGLTTEEFKTFFKEQHINRLKNKWDYRLPSMHGYNGMESQCDVYHRVLQPLTWLIHNDKPSLVVGHKTVNKAILLHLLEDRYNISRETFDMIPMPTDVVYAIDVNVKTLYHNNGSGWKQGLIQF